MSYSERIDTVKSELDALVTYANKTTGESDTTISDAVETLVKGFESSGNSGDSLHFFGDLFELIAEFDTELDETCTSTTTQTKSISQSVPTPDDYPYFFIAQTILVDDKEDDTSYVRPLITMQSGVNRAKSNFYCAILTNYLVFTSAGAVVNGATSVCGMTVGSVTNASTITTMQYRTNSGVTPVKGTYTTRIYKSKNKIG